jgi:hypothetical protein
MSFVVNLFPKIIAVSVSIPVAIGATIAVEATRQLTKYLLEDKR